MSDGGAVNRPGGLGDEEDEMNMELTWSTWEEMENDFAEQQKKIDLDVREWNRDSEERAIVLATAARAARAAAKREDKKYRENLYKYKGSDADAWQDYVSEDDD